MSATLWRYWCNHYDFLNVCNIFSAVFKNESNDGNALDFSSDDVKQDQLDTRTKPIKPLGSCNRRNTTTTPVPRETKSGKLAAALPKEDIPTPSLKSTSKRIVKDGDLLENPQRSRSRDGRSSQRHRKSRSRTRSRSKDGRSSDRRIKKGNRSKEASYYRSKDDELDEKICTYVKIKHLEKERALLQNQVDEDSLRKFVYSSIQKYR